MGSTSDAIEPVAGGSTTCTLLGTQVGPARRFGLSREFRKYRIRGATGRTDY